MYLILFFVGIVLVFAGALLVRYGVPVVDAASSALFTSGIMSFVGGVIMVGLSAVVRTLSRIAERLEMQPVPVPPIASVGRDDPAPRPARTPPTTVPAAPKPSLLGWFGRGSAQAPARPEAAPAAAPAVDLAPLTRMPEEPRPAPIPPPPPVPAPVVAPPVAVKPAPAVPKPVVAAKPAAKPAPANGTAEATIYKSGVIDGMAYTLFMDGSIEAELPQGRVRFASVEDLQKHILGLQ
jgi:hypothetical protein